MSNHFTFILKKEKNIHPFTQKTSGERTSKNSLKNFIITHINSSKNKFVEQTKEEPIHSSSMEPEIELRTGRWTEDEHSKFIKGILEYGNDWKMVQKIIKTRSSTQARSHAQKFFLKINKIVKSQSLQSNPETLLKCIYNSNENFNEGMPLTIIQRKRLLNAITSNLKNLKEEENKNNNKERNEDKNINSQKEGEESNFFDKVRNKSKNFKNHTIIIENEKNNYLANNSDIRDKKVVQENKRKFCCKKRRNSLDSKKIFKINKVIKCKYSNNFINKKNAKYNKIILENLKKPKIKKKIKIKKSKNKKQTENKFNCNIIYPIINGNYIINNNIINITNNYNNLICNNNNINSNSNNINYNNNSNDMNNYITNNFNINSMNQFNFPESLIDFGSNLKKNNCFFENEYPKNNSNEYQNKLFFDEIEFNDSFKNNDNNDNFNEENLSIEEQNDGISFINKEYDIFKYYE